MEQMNMQATTASNNRDNEPLKMHHRSSTTWANGNGGGVGWRSVNATEPYSMEEQAPAMALIAPQILRRSSSSNNNSKSHMLLPIAAATHVNNPSSSFYPTSNSNTGVPAYNKTGNGTSEDDGSGDDSDECGTESSGVSERAIVNHHHQPNQVKFVNATVEILQNQIRKEEAPKKKRTRTTPDQLRILQKAFNADPMPNSSSRLVLAKRLGMNARAVQVWFQNRRAKEKLEAKRAEISPSSSTSNNNNGPNSRPYRISLPNGSHQYSTSAQSQSTCRDRSASHPVNNHHSVEDTSYGTAGYDLGMYFGEVSLAQYANGFDLTGYNDPAMSHNGTNAMFDDFVTTGGLANLPNGIENADFSHMNNYTLARFGGEHDTSGAADVDGTVNEDNNLGIIFDAGTLDHVDCSNLDAQSTNTSSIHPSAYHPHPNMEYYYYSPRHNSIDVLGMMGEAAVASLEERIYSRPASREAFITMPLGHSVPMPTKPRSLSVPDLSSSTNNSINARSSGNELMCIREEEMMFPPSGVCSPFASRRTSVAGDYHLVASTSPSNRPSSPPSCMILQCGGGGVMEDDLHSYLNEISNAI